MIYTPLTKPAVFDILEVFSGDCFSTLMVDKHGPTCLSLAVGFPEYFDLHIPFFSVVSPQILENTSLHLVNCCSHEDVI